MTTAPDPAQPQSTRDVFREVLLELMLKDERVVCLDSDSGLFTAVDWQGSAERYVNLGIAEQNLMGVAAGLAASGHIPYVNSIAAFAATRALESVKLDIALNHLPVRIAATHGGLSAGRLGPTHHSLEDLAVMRLLPHMTVLVPSDAGTANQLIRAAHELPGPVYLRLGRNATPNLGPGYPRLRIGEAQQLLAGGDVTLVATGPYPVRAALAAADELTAAGIEATVLNMHTVKPLDVRALVTAAESTRGIVTIEEHWAIGGLGSAVAEVVSEIHDPVPVRRVAVGDSFATGSGDHLHLLERNGITASSVVRQALLIVDGDRGRNARGATS